MPVQSVVSRNNPIYIQQIHSPSYSAVKHIQGVPISVYFKFVSFFGRFKSGWYPLFGGMTVSQMLEYISQIGAGMWGTGGRIIKVWHSNFGCLDDHRRKKVKTIFRGGEVAVVSNRSVNTAADGGSPIFRDSNFQPNREHFNYPENALRFVLVPEDGDATTVPDTSDDDVSDGSEGNTDAEAEIEEDFDPEDLINQLDFDIQEGENTERFNRGEGDRVKIVLSSLDRSKTIGMFFDTRETVLDIYLTVEELTEMKYNDFKLVGMTTKREWKTETVISELDADNHQAYIIIKMRGGGTGADKSAKVLKNKLKTRGFLDQLKAKKEVPICQELPELKEIEKKIADFHISACASPFNAMENMLIGLDLDTLNGVKTDLKTNGSGSAEGKLKVVASKLFGEKMVKLLEYKKSIDDLTEQANFAIQHCYSLASEQDESFTIKQLKNGIDKALNQKIGEARAVASTQGQQGYANNGERMQVS
eukprot:Skav235340  [mRNA]  locus=scaffold520:884694:886121:+ [translate_table: standard]